LNGNIGHGSEMEIYKDSVEARCLEPLKIMNEGNILEESE
jgi:hypothetical protein